MDKSFNDQELSDIMKEIEALEDNFQNEVVKMETVAPKPVEKVVPVQEEEEAPAPVASAPQKEAKVMPMAMAPKAKAGSTCPTTMSFKVSGDLNLSLQFDIEGKIISLEVNEHGFAIQMEGGMTFNVPFKKAA